MKISPTSIMRGRRLLVDQLRSSRSATINKSMMTYGHHGGLVSRALASSTQSKFSSGSNSNSHNKNSSFFTIMGAASLLGAATTGTMVTMLDKQQEDDDSDDDEEEEKEEGWYAQKRPKQKYESPRPIPVKGKESHHADYNDPPPRPDLPTYTLEEVASHNEMDSMWFTFRGGVYDLTFFKYGHPGGTPRLLMAAGQDLEPYWEVYRQHFRSHIVAWMEKHRIGNLSPEDAEAAKNFQFGDMFETDPKRDPNLLGCTIKPWCGECRLDLLAKEYITPNELFYVRNHLAVPDIDPDDYALVIKGQGIKNFEFTLEDLKTKFKKYEVTTTLQCAGNRREDMHGDKKLYLAPHWVVGAMGTAKWGGVRMRDVLEYCGVDVDALALGKKELGEQQYLQFLGYDTDETGFCYGSGIPMSKAVDALGDAMFVFEMNGKQLPRDHGFPVRALVPGFTGNAQCKWLHKVIIANEPSQKPWQQKSYRGFAPDINFENDLSHWPPPRLDQAPIVYEMPVQSIVCNPPQNSLIGMKNNREIEVKGVAWSGGGKEIQRVDISIDGGKNFTAAELYKPIKQDRNRHWAWTQFSKTLTLPEDVRKRLDAGEQVSIDITSKALNSDFNVQPERMEPHWNARGVCINHWYHVNTTLDPHRADGTIRHDHTEEEFGNTPSGGKFKHPWDQHGFMADPKHQTDPKAHVEPESEYF